VPVHLLERNRPEPRFCAVRQLYHANLTTPALHLDFRDAKDAIVVLSLVGRVHTDLAHVFKPEALNDVDRESKLRRAGIDQCLALNVFSLSV